MSNKKPSAITVHRGRVYLSTARHHRVQVDDDQLVKRFVNPFHVDTQC